MNEQTETYKLPKSTEFDPMEQLQQALIDKQYNHAEKVALELLRINPFAAQVWVYLGEALLHQGYGQTARAVFERGWLLDPQATWVGAVQQALAQSGEGALHAEIERILTVNKVTVAAAIITRNEARCIERCIRSLIEAVDEIVVLDYDSTDGTLELIEHMPKVKVVRGVAFDDDFAAKRNQGLGVIESDWVLWVDADEWLDAGDARCVREAAALFDTLNIPAILSICQANHIQGRIAPDYSLPRMFPLRRGLHYYGRVHEQVVSAGKGVFDSDLFRHSVRIRLHHDGYEPHIMKFKNKLDRNIALLEKMLEDEPDHPGWLLYYGRELLGRGEKEKAIAMLLRAERASEHVPGFGRLLDVLMFLLKIYMSDNQLDQAEEVCRRALAMEPDFPDAQYYMAQIQMRRAVGLLREAESHLKRSKQTFHTYRGTVTADGQIPDWKADLALADLARLAGKTTEARAIYQDIAKRHPELESVKNKLEKLEQL
ncbi:glycosyltransferase [Paenibacillus eucommiae]|uniref:Glycosyltransferase involved in cell wall biosynthesis n=1 Tax=Paenibacillus eucommiae TaxID=1355755 RepID=A0ABS4J796_9BACL|nr:glycosyltransferase [Paenibacillus eucommiae]MBP1995712.1 glycosyltransferase involved in cell wall biosynthesis [Paenibacillus eucommiae]